MSNFPSRIKITDIYPELAVRPGWPGRRRAVLLAIAETVAAGVVFLLIVAALFAWLFVGAAAQ